VKIADCISGQVSDSYNTCERYNRSTNFNWVSHISFYCTVHCMRVQYLLSLFDQFYNYALHLLNYFYPERTVTVTSRDPEFVTPVIKASVHHKNTLMRASRIEASALAAQIGKEIATRCKTRLCKVDGKVDSRGMWTVVRDLTGLYCRWYQSHFPKSALCCHFHWWQLYTTSSPI